VSDNRLAFAVAALDALPQEPLTGMACGRRYLATKLLFKGGRSVKFVAEELAGRDYISLNLYKLATGLRLRPCEMSHDKVIRFLLEFRPDEAVG
jgi:hypothetical protein